MTTHRFALTLSHCRLWSIGVTALAFGLVACSSDGLGLKQIDASAGTKVDAIGSEAGLGKGGAGGSTAKFDAAMKTDTGSVGSGGASGPSTIDASAIDGVMTGKGGAAGSVGMDGASAGGASGATGPTSTGGTTSTGGVISRDGGVDAAGTFGTGGTTGGTGGTLGRDAGPDTYIAADVSLVQDVATTDTAMARDLRIPAPDAVAIDGAVACGDLDEPCCEQRTCNSPATVCTSGGAGSGGVCIACGGDGEACCAGETCTAPGTTCSGGGRGGGTCR